MSLLITAFGRFDGGPNCSETLLERLAAGRAELERIWGRRVAFARLAVDAEGVETELARALASARPSHVLLMGQAAGRATVSLERIARNCLHLGVPDERGRVGALGPVRAGGPDERAATWPDLEAAAAAMTRAGAPAKTSDDAGSHLCNQALYLALEAGERAEPPFVATFMHLPLLPEQVAAGVPAAARLADCAALPLDDMARAVRAFLRHTRGAAVRTAGSSMRLPRRSWMEMTTEEFSSSDVSDWIAVMPVAAVEQHGPHLPVGVDAMIGEGYLARAWALIPEDLPVTFLPMQRIGTSAEHTAFPGTLSLSPRTVIGAWIEIGASVARAGLKKLVLMNSHGGNTAVLDVVARTLRVEHGLLAVTASWQRLGYPAGAFTPQEIRHDIHAGRIETSLMRAFRPELVHMAKAEDFRPYTVDMERDFTHLRASTPAGFGWMAQDINASGAIGDAAAGSAEVGEAAAEFGARAFVALLEDVARFPMERLGDVDLARL